jgi:outer membrane protein assembly factor BamB
VMRDNSVKKNILILLAACCFTTAWFASAPLAWAARPEAPGDWLQFRGPRSDSVVDSADFPTQWDPERMVAWKIDLPGRGPSSPIVVDGRVIVTASSGVKQDLLHVLAFDAADGHPLWQRQFWATGRTITHPQTSNATPTPASDGRNVFAFFSSNDLVALDLDGNLLWYRGLAQDFPRLGNDVGMASSPVVVGNTVIVQSESQGEAFVTGIDTGDGTTRWHLDRERAAGWTSPALLQEGKNPTAVLIQSSKSISAVDPASGDVLWTYEQACDTISSACADNGLVFVPGKGLTALRAGAERTTPEVVWSKNQVQAGAASPIAVAGRVSVVNRGGVLIVADAKDGEILSRTRLEGNFWGTPVMAGNRLFAVSFEGLGQLVEISADGRSGKVITKIPFGEAIQASPAVVGGAVFVRGDAHLWKLTAPKEN